RPRREGIAYFDSLLSPNRPDHQIPIRVPGIAAAIESFAILMKSSDCFDFDQIAGSLQCVENMIPLGVHVGSDVVSDLTRRMAEADPPVESRRSRPKRPA